MNPMLNNFQSKNSLPPELLNNIQQIKQNMQNIRNNVQLINEVNKMCNGMSQEEFFKMTCNKLGLDPNAIIREFQK